MNNGPDAAGKAAVLTKLSDRTRDIAGARQHRPCMTRKVLDLTGAVQKSWVRSRGEPMFKSSGAARATR